MLTCLTEYQEKIASVVESHTKQERLRGCEIRPAEVKAQPTDKVTAKAESRKYSTSLSNQVFEYLLFELENSDKVWQFAQPLSVGTRSWTGD